MLKTATSFEQIKKGTAIRFTFNAPLENNQGILLKNVALLPPDDEFSSPSVGGGFWQMFASQKRANGIITRANNNVAVCIDDLWCVGWRFCLYDFQKAHWYFFQGNKYSKLAVAKWGYFSDRKLFVNLPK